ncbi:MAG: DUF1295 domain-containing protein [Spirochaetes bacterium]|nr:DUF1295 domain-containing protein [Spirochaetota bacterium]
MKYLLIGFLWAAYCALHSFLISTSFTKLMTRLLKNYYAFYRLFFNIISIILLVPLIKFTAHQDNNIIITYPPALNIIRYILISCTLIMFIWPFFSNYDFLSFFGIRQILNLGREGNTSKEINKNGLLGIVRHPMYFALIIYLWCQTFSAADIVVNTVLTIYIIIGTFLEEKKLVLEFGESYIKYQKEVPMLIPFTK